MPSGWVVFELHRTARTNHDCTSNEQSNLISWLVVVVVVVVAVVVVDGDVWMVDVDGDIVVDVDTVAVDIPDTSHTRTVPSYELVASHCPHALKSKDFTQSENTPVSFHCTVPAATHRRVAKYGDVMLKLKITHEEGRVGKRLGKSTVS